MADKATLSVGGNTYEFPVVEGSENELAIDIKTLRSSTGLITLDPGYKNTGSCESAITFLDGEKGDIADIRGYAIEELAEKADFLEVAYLLIFGELPNKEQLGKFHSDIKAESHVDEEMKKILDGFPKSAHPMGVLSALTSALIAFNPSAVDVTSEEDLYHAIVRLLAKFPVLVSWTLRKKMGLPLDYGDDSLGICGEYPQNDV